MKARLRILQHAQRVSVNISQTCRFFGVSRSLYYIWKKRFEKKNLAQEAARVDPPRRTRCHRREAKLTRWPGRNETKLCVKVKRATELVKIARRDREQFDCATWDKATELPKEEFKREVEKHLTGQETEPWDMIYFKVNFPCGQALETVALMLGNDK